MKARDGDFFLVAWLACLLPIVAAHAAYLIAAATGDVAWCLPYLEGCTSVSRAARHGWPNVVFKLLMFPGAFVLALFWIQVRRALAPSDAAAARRTRQIVALGIGGALFLVLYVTFLGADGPAYQWLRRYGTVFFFGFTVLAQMLLASLLVSRPTLDARSRAALLGGCLGMLILGLASIPLQHAVADAKAAVNAIEWCFVLLMSGYFPVAAHALRRMSSAGGGPAR